MTDMTGSSKGNRGVMQTYQRTLQGMSKDVEEARVCQGMWRVVTKSIKGCGKACQGAWQEVKTWQDVARIVLRTWQRHREKQKVRGEKTIVRGL